MALSTEVRRVMGFLVVMTGEAGLACRDLPRVGCVTAHTRDVAMFALFVQPTELGVTRLAVDHRFEFCFFKMACVAGHGHHRGGAVNFVTRDAVEGWPVTCPVAEIAEGRRVLSL
jgi:hypothetical protein